MGALQYYNLTTEAPFRHFSHDKSYEGLQTRWKLRVSVDQQVTFTDFILAKENLIFSFPIEGRV